jgi:ABC-type bacteriocin/lantibiotic exporter with double-glycine peptidase domain
MLKIFSIFNKEAKNKFLFLIFLIINLSFSEVLIFSLLPEILSFFSDSKTYKNFFLDFLYNYKFNFLSMLSLFFIIFLIRSILVMIVSYWKSDLVKSVNDDVSEKIYKNYLSQDYYFFVTNNSSYLISNVIVEIEKFSYRVIDALIYLITEVFIIIAVISFLLISFFKPTLILIFVIFSFFFLFYKFYKARFKKLGEIKSQSEANKIENLQKSFSVIQNIKIDHLEDFFYLEFKKNTLSSSKGSFFYSFISDLPKPIIELFVVILIFLIIYFFYFQLNISKQEIFLMLSIFVICMFRVLPSANRILQCLNSIKYYYPSIDIISEELNKKNNLLNISKNEPLFHFDTSIKLEDVNFSFSDNKKSILENINLEIKKNHIIGIQGSSGSGKTTLLNIICGLLKPTSGSILADDKLINSFGRSYQKKIGYVPQKIYLTNDTIIKNIILGKDEKDFDLDLFKEVILKSGLDLLLDQLPDGYNSSVGERGLKLSGGQQQRIGIARALYKNPEIIILDEATNALDDNSENQIMEKIYDLKDKITIIIVSHKKDIFRHCDVVYNIKNTKLEIVKNSS